LSKSFGENEKSGGGVGFWCEFVGEGGEKGGRVWKVWNRRVLVGIWWKMFIEGGQHRADKLWRRGC
jgi:hypothetical protein